MVEEWKDIQEFEGYYQISNLGRVKSLSKKIKYPCGRVHITTDKILKGFTDKGSYRSCVLVKNTVKKTYSIHRLVAEAFLIREEGLSIVNHKDGNPSNNNVTNLEWCTQSHNIDHAIDNGLKRIGEHCYNSKLNTKQVISIYDMCWYSNKTMKQIATEFEISKSTVSDIKHGRTRSIETRGVRNEIRSDSVKNRLDKIVY